MCIRDRVYGAFKEIGFTDIIEVAEGAMMTTSNEAHELLEKLEEGQKFMTTSCCPSYIELVEKHMTEMKPYVSTTDVYKRQPLQRAAFSISCSMNARLSL